MNTGTFRSSIDWSHEIVNSLLWISIAFVIAAPCLLLALVVIARTTEWGRQFWRVTGGYFTGRQSMVVWTVLALLLVFTIITVRISVLISFYTNDVFTSLQVALQGIATDKSAVTDSGEHSTVSEIPSGRAVRRQTAARRRSRRSAGSAVGVPPPT